MKESTSKTSTRAQSGKSACESKASKTSKTTARGAVSSRTAVTPSHSTATGRVSRSNNPQGHNQYTKK